MMIRLPRRVVLSVISLLMFAPVVVLTAENWPSWRGPTGNGISNERNVPVEWSRDENVAWRLPLPGAAGATPVVWGERIFLTSEVGEDLVLLCVSTRGRELWRQQVSTGSRTVRDDEGNYASPSPVTDGQHVWSMMGTGDLGCYTVSGQPVWKVDLQERYGEFNIQFGMASTPVLHAGRLYVQLIHGDGNPSTNEAVVACLDAATGEGVWQSPRVTGAHTENEHSYASPILYNFGDLELLITHGADYTIAYGLENGHEIWRMGGLNPHEDAQRRYHPTLRFVASPAAAEGIVVIPTAKGQGVYAIRPDLEGDLTENPQALLWKLDGDTPDVPSPLIHGGLVYLCRENGNLLCVDAESGETVYHERTHRTRHRASPVYADGHVYLAARDGRVTVVKAGRQFEIVAENELGEELSASPVFVDGTLYLRTFNALWAIRR